MHKKQPPFPTLNQINPVHALPSYFIRSIPILSSLLCLGFPSSLFPSGLSTKSRDHCYSSLLWVGSMHVSSLYYTWHFVSRINTRQPPHALSMAHTVCFHTQHPSDAHAAGLTNYFKLTDSLRQNLQVSNYKHKDPFWPHNLRTTRLQQTKRRFYIPLVTSYKM
jgi:hypothetical protein